MPNSDYAQLMLSFALFQGYTAWGTRSLIERGRLRHCEHGQLLYSQGEPALSVVLVLTGEVEHFLETRGRQIHLGSAGPSHVLSDVQVVGGMAHPASARATAGTVVLEWDADDFKRLIGSDTLFAQRVLHQTAVSLAQQAETLTASLAAMQPDN